MPVNERGQHLVMLSHGLPDNVAVRSDTRLQQRRTLLAQKSKGATINEALV